MTAGQGPRAARLYIAVFVVGALALVWATLRGPAWAAPLVLVILGLLSAVAPRATPGPVRRTSLFAIVLGMALLARALGWM